MKRTIQIALIIIAILLSGYLIYINITPKKEESTLFIKYQDETTNTNISIGQTLKIKDIEFKIIDIDRTYVKIKLNKYIYQLVNNIKDENSTTNTVIIENGTKEIWFINTDNSQIIFKYN